MALLTTKSAFCVSRIGGRGARRSCVAAVGVIRFREIGNIDAGRSVAGNGDIDEGPILVGVTALERGQFAVEPALCWESHHPIGRRVRPLAIDIEGELRAIAAVVESQGLSGDYGWPVRISIDHRPSPIDGVPCQVLLVSGNRLESGPPRKNPCARLQGAATISYF